MSFVALPPAAEPTQPPAPEAPIENDGFWPDVDPGAIRQGEGISTSVTPVRLRKAIIGAMMTVRGDTITYAAACRAAGYESLADVPADQLDGQSMQVLLYLRAIGLYAKAELIERFRSFDTTGAGDKRADEQTPDELRRDAQHAVRDLVGRSRTTVDLI